MITTPYLVSGMTCAHCVSAVTEEIGKLAGVTGVTGVEVDLVAGGRSRVAVTSTAPLSLTAVRAVVDEAGCELVGDGQ